MIPYPYCIEEQHPAVQILPELLAEHPCWHLPQGHPARQPEALSALIGGLLFNGLSVALWQPDALYCQTLAARMQAWGLGDLLTNRSGNQPKPLLASRLPLRLQRPLDLLGDYLRTYRQKTASLRQNALITTKNQPLQACRQLPLPLDLRDFEYWLQEAEDSHRALPRQQSGPSILAEALWANPSRLEVEQKALETLDRLLLALRGAADEIRQALRLYQKQLEDHLTEFTAQMNERIDDLLLRIAPSAKKSLNFPLQGGQMGSEEGWQALKDYHKLRDLHERQALFPFQFLAVPRLQQQGGFAPMQAELQRYQARLMAHYGEKETLLEAWAAELSPSKGHPQYSKEAYLLQLFRSLEGLLHNLRQSQTLRFSRYFRSDKLVDCLEEIGEWQDEVYLLRQDLGTHFRAYYDWQYLLRQCPAEYRPWLQALAQEGQANWLDRFRLHLMGRQGGRGEASPPASPQAILAELAELYQAMREQLPKIWPDGGALALLDPETEELPQGYDVLICACPPPEGQSLPTRQLYLYSETQAPQAPMQPQAPPQLPEHWRLMLQHQGWQHYRYRAEWQGLPWPLLLLDAQNQLEAVLGQYPVFWNLLDAHSPWWDLALCRLIERYNLPIKAW